VDALKMMSNDGILADLLVGRKQLMVLFNCTERISYPDLSAPEKPPEAVKLERWAADARARIERHLRKLGLPAEPAKRITERMPVVTFRPVRFACLMAMLQRDPGMADDEGFRRALARTHPSGFFLAMSKMLRWVRPAENCAMPSHLHRTKCNVQPSALLQQPHHFRQPGRRTTSCQAVGRAVQ
jgi:hypothetical protein